MQIGTAELREKDVINVCGGRKLGYICDFQIDTECGRICAVYVTDQLLGVFGTKNTARIPWEKIVCVGTDTVLVEMPEGFCCEPCAEKRGKPKKNGGWLF